jgi:hypothetical protein
MRNLIQRDVKEGYISNTIKENKKSPESYENNSKL